jgi:membrane-associated phospholipid phosphatase
VLQSKHYANYWKSVLVCLFLAFSIGMFLLIYGKINSFELINGTHNRQLDQFFRYVTVLGDGLIYVPLVVYSILFNRKFLLPVVFAIIICTFLTHFLKRVVFPNEMRPVYLELHNIIIHKVDGVAMNKRHSFPSGHTSTAFTLALLLVYTMRRSIWAFVLPLIAVVVGYSRVYLAQHFLTDVLAGIGIGIVTATISLWLYALILERRNRRAQPEPGWEAAEVGKKL